MKLFQISKTYSVDIFLCLFLFGGLMLSFSGHGTSVDENLVIQTVESLVTQGDFTVHPMFQALPGPDGKYYSRYGFSFPFLLTPFYLLGYGIIQCFPPTSVTFSQVFLGNPHFFLMLMGSVLITVFLGWMFYRLCLLLGSSNQTAVFLTVALIFSTPFWPYSKTLFRLTAASAVLIAVLVLVLRQFQSMSKTRSFLLVGLVAFGLNLREDLILGLMAIGLFVLWKGQGTARWGTAAALILGAILGFLLWGGHNWIRFGSFFVENYEDLTFNYPLILSLPQLLFGLRRGLILYAPLALLLPLSFWWLWKKRQLEIWILCAGIFLLYLFLYAKSDMWHGGRCWGPRHMYFLLPFALLPGIDWLENFTQTKKNWFFLFASGMGAIMNWPGVYAYQGKYQDFFSAPSFFSLIFQPVIHPEYVTFDELDLWWIRMIKLFPLSLWPIAFLGMLFLTLWSAYRLWKLIHVKVNPIQSTPIQGGENGRFDSSKSE